jgi:hypothetical protein
MMTLFIDFDGVLHPAWTDTLPLFDRLPLLESVLRAVPDAEVVISSSWREAYTIDEIRGIFSKDIRPQIIGFTPRLPNIRRYQRQREIEAWLRTNRHPGARWVALDDYEEWFEPGCRHLILCQVPLDDETAAELLRRLKKGR